MTITICRARRVTKSLMRYSVAVNVNPRTLIKQTICIYTRLKQYRTRKPYCVEWHNTVFDSKQLAIRSQAVYFLHLTMPSVTWLRLGYISVICRVILFSVSNNSVCISSISVASQHCGILVLIRNIGHGTLPKIWLSTFLVRILVRNVQSRGMILNWF